jgi:hypothetical protein
MGQGIVNTLLNFYLEHWNPDTRPVHCSNCGNAKVSGPPDEPEVECAWDGGQPSKLIRLVRPKNPRGFRAAERCAHFTSMSDLSD